ncbi:MAG: DUF3667 domain-containing protein [Parvularculaceae bacterium]
MAIDTPDIEPIDEGAAEAAAIAAAAACPSCGAKIVGAWCAGCGQKNDDMRRSSVVLLKDFMVDTFSFDGRMWRTLGLLAASPGTVPSQYSHGKRSRYTPPVRLFLVVSFLFFLILSLTHTLIIAVEVRAHTPEESARAKAALEEGLREAGPKAADAVRRARIEARTYSGPVVIDGQSLDCDLNATTRYFVRADDVKVDLEAWSRCRDSLMSGIRSEIEGKEEASAEFTTDKATALTTIERIIDGVARAIENPQAFNASLNDWLPRVMFLMTPALALILALFLRGRDALIFDHLVFALYAHAAAFAIIGLAVIAAQLRLPHVFAAASIALALYFIVAIKRGYGRGWIKSVWTGVAAGLIYLLVLSGTVMSIISNQVLQGA